ncbi:DNA ligase [Aureococcus anophagefferens]|nr:DNA ligase [Aureococcus anophagefferens]
MKKYIIAGLCAGLRRRSRCGVAVVAAATAASGSRRRGAAATKALQVDGLACAIASSRSRARHRSHDDGPRAAGGHPREHDGPAPAGPRDAVGNAECGSSFDSPYSAGGLFVNLRTYEGCGADFVAADAAKSGCALYAHHAWRKAPRGRRRDEAKAAPGGWASASTAASRPRTPTLARRGRPVEPLSPGGVVALRGVRAAENLWLNLSTGYVGGGRDQSAWGGPKGSNGALHHFEATGKKYPLVVKLGTISATGAELYSYAADEDGPVLDAKLAAHLKFWGINAVAREDGEDDGGARARRLRSRRYAKPAGALRGPDDAPALLGEADATRAEAGKVAPRAFRRLFGLGHAEFATPRQQDGRVPAPRARRPRRAEHGALQSGRLEAAATADDAAAEAAGAKKKVEYGPYDPLREAHAAALRLKRRLRASRAKPKVALDACLARWAADETIGDFLSSATGARGAARTAAQDVPATCSSSEAILAQLLSMGFDENGCKRACVATKNAGAEAATEPRAPSRPATAARSAADWIFSHMDDLDGAVEAAFAAPAGGAPAPPAPGADDMDDGDAVYELRASSPTSARTRPAAAAHLRGADGNFVIFDDESATLKAFFAPKKSKAAPKRASEESTSSTEAKDVAAPAAKKSKPEPAAPAGRLRRPDRGVRGVGRRRAHGAAPAAAKAAPAEAPAAAAPAAAAPAAAKPAAEAAKPKEKQAPVFANPGAGVASGADWAARAACAAIAAVFEKIEATTKRLEIQGHVRDLLGQVMRHAPGDLTACVFLLCNKVAPAFENLEMGIGDSLLMKAVAHAFGKNAKHVKGEYESRATSASSPKRKKQKTLSFGAKPKPLLAAKVLAAYREICAISGSKSQDAKIGRMQKLMTAAPAKRVLPKDARAAAADAVVKQCYAEAPSYATLCEGILSRPLWALPEACALAVGVPVFPMLAKPTKSVGEVLKRLGGIAITCEHKYDGERFQAHMLPNGDVKVFSRNLQETTKKWPEVQAVVRAARRPGARNRSSSTPRRPAAAAAAPAEHKFAFADAVDVPASCDECDAAEHIQHALEASIVAKSEGLMVKTLEANATYEPSKRSLNWLKLKKDYLDGVGDSLDLVVVGAYMGRGKRTGVFGAYLCACLDADTGDLQSVCKIGTGFSDEDLKTLDAQARAMVLPAKPRHAGKKRFRQPGASRRCAVVDAKAHHVWRRLEVKPSMYMDMAMPLQKASGSSSMDIMSSIFIGGMSSMTMSGIF